VVGVRPAAADPVASLKAQAESISQKLVQEQLIVDADRQQYAVAAAAVDADHRALAHVGEQIAQDEAQIDKEVLEVRQQAVTSYMEAGGEASTADTVLFTGNAEQSQLASEYAAIASGDIETSLDALRLTRRILQGEEAVLAQEQLRDQSDAARQGVSLASAGTTAGQLEALQGQVTGRLAAAVAAQGAAQKAAAAAALAAAADGADFLLVPDPVPGPTELAGIAAAGLPYYADVAAADTTDGALPGAAPAPQPTGRLRWQPGALPLRL